MDNVLGRNPNCPRERALARFGAAVAAKNGFEQGAGRATRASLPHRSGMKLWSPYLVARPDHLARHRRPEPKAPMWALADALACGVDRSEVT